VQDLAILLSPQAQKQHATGVVPGWARAYTARPFCRRLFRRPAFTDVESGTVGHQQLLNGTSRKGQDLSSLAAPPSQGGLPVSRSFPIQFRAC
jgi:hypothetical protein